MRATYVAFLDVADAYGSCDHVMLFARLWEMGVRGTMWRLFRAWYGERRSHVRVDGEVTEDYPTRCGVAQGAVTSPFLYAAFLNGLLAQLRASGLGSWEGGVWAGCHCYADDIALCADTREELEEMLVLARPTRRSGDSSSRPPSQKSWLPCRLRAGLTVRRAPPGGRARSPLLLGHPQPGFSAVSCRILVVPRRLCTRWSPLTPRMMCWQARRPRALTVMSLPGCPCCKTAEELGELREAAAG
jgi:hypothetical protein